jgi:hypothetical protein
MYSRRRPGVPIGEYQWLINQEVEVDLQLMALPSGPGAPQVVFIPPGGGLSQSPSATLMGLPLRSCEFSHARGVTGDIALVRTKGYVTISKGGINETPSSHVGFLRDQEAIKFTQRIDGRPMFDSPTTAYRGSAGYEYADFIALA